MSMKQLCTPKKAVDCDSDGDPACPLRLPIMRCYGRGKTLAEVRLCHLPKELLALCVGPSANAINQFSDALLNHKANGAAKPARTGRGRGRGKMLEHLTENMDTTVPGDVPKKDEEKENASSSEPSAYNTAYFRKAPRTSTIIMRSDIDLDFVQHYRISKDDNAESLEEFPALGVSQIGKIGSKSKKIKEFEPLTSTLENMSDMLTADGDVTSHRSWKSLVLQSHTDESSSGESPSTSQSGQEAMRLTDSARDSSVTFSPKPSLAGYVDNTVAPSSKEAATKKKGNGGWRLDGPLVVHFEGIAKQHCGKLREMVNQLATIVEEERKNQKAGRSFRFLFENAEDCKYVVSCMNEASDIFDDSTASAPITCYCLKAEDLSLE